MAFSFADRLDFPSDLVGLIHVTQLKIRIYVLAQTSTKIMQSTSSQTFISKNIEGKCAWVDIIRFCCLNNAAIILWLQYSKKQKYY